LAGCEESQTDPSTAPPPPPDTLRQLDELSVEQRRVFLKGFPGDWRADTDMARGAEEPPAALAVPEDARIIDLPDATGLQLGEMPLSEAITRRRSRREFTDAPLSLDQLSFLLGHTQGITAVEEDSSGKAARGFRAAPSGGARYPLETFIAVQRIDGLDPGLYRYLPEGHRLLVVAEDAGIGEKIRQACYGNATVSGAAVVFIWAAVPCRSEWKYGCISHKMIAMEAGHVCQNLYLAAESIGAGTCAMLGYHQPALDGLIGVDGSDVFTVYLAPVGKVLPP
jgi:SagB-type dehydrogenase family enzyme